MKIRPTRYDLLIGSPNRKPLYKWIEKMDLQKWNILIKDPLAIRNFLTQYTDYMLDEDQFGTAEFWQDPKLIMRTHKDDCEGLNTLACNILYTLGFDCRLAVGRYDPHNYRLKPQDRQFNHAYGLLFDNEHDNNPYIIECTGDDVLPELPKIDNHQEYYTHFCGSAILQKNFLCNHLVEEVNE